MKAAKAGWWLAFVSWSALAAPPPADGNVFVQALVGGRSSKPLPVKAEFLSIEQAIHERTGDTGPILVEAVRVVRFRQQAKCGRVAFMVVQPSSHRGWTDLGGQINICEDGGPPWKVCPERPGVLVPPGRQCADGTTGVDTPEVAAAIRAAQADIAK